MNAKELAEAKDGILYERALKNVPHSVVLCTDGASHLAKDGEILCGAKAKRTNRKSLNQNACEACRERLQDLVLEQMKIESRNYWLNPSSREANMSLPEELKPKKAPKIKFEKVMLPDELLPTGSGVGWGVGVSYDHQGSQG